jgi:hypothetical protein
MSHLSRFAAKLMPSKPSWRRSINHALVEALVDLRNHVSILHKPEQRGPFAYLKCAMGVLSGFGVEPAKAPEARCA